MEAGCSAWDGDTHCEEAVVWTSPAPFCLSFSCILSCLRWNLADCLPVLADGNPRYHVREGFDRAQGFCLRCGRAVPCFSASVGPAVRVGVSLRAAERRDCSNACLAFMDAHRYGWGCGEGFICAWVVSARLACMRPWPFR